MTVEAGDPATLEVLRSLPEGSIVTAPDGTIGQRNSRGGLYGDAWILPGDSRMFPAEALAPRSLTVLRVGWTPPTQITTERAA